MRYWIIIFFFFSFATLLLGQQDSSLIQFNTLRLDKQQKAMTVLGTWAVANIAVGSILASKKSGEAKYFHQMNAGWNAVNLVIAGIGYYGVSKIDPAALDLFGSVEGNYQIQKILLFNAGLDVGYMLGGAYMMGRSKHLALDKKPERLKGWGKSIVLQGGFLFVFDVATYWVLASGNEHLQPLLGNLSFTGDAIGWRMSF